MVQKRFFYDEETYSIPRKHPRQVEYNNQLISFSEFVPRDLGSPRFHISGESGLTENAIEPHEKLASEINGSRFPIHSGKYVDDNVSRRLYSSIGFNEEYSHPQSPVYISSRTDYFSPEHPRTVTRHDDTYSSLLRNPPRKAVPIGSHYQANIPECKSRSVRDSQNDEDKLMGTCVISMPDSKCANKLENAKIECRCFDEGSIRCVRQHVIEARDKLEGFFGKEKFEELGFRVMGEQVAKQWSKEEEELFYEVVFSNPMSMGKNFWNCLSAVFPFRSKMDIVSYYFNVFMLRRRAEQNRCKSKDGVYDSDDDEWQGTEDPESESTEDDEDPVEDSLNRDGSARFKCPTSPNYVREVQYDSRDNTHWPCGYNDHDLETCNERFWDVDYTVCPKFDVDLLSTCSMIEEVFGGGSMNYKARDDKNVS